MRATHAMGGTEVTVPTVTVDLRIDLSLMECARSAVNTVPLVV